MEHYADVCTSTCDSQTEILASIRQKEPFNIQKSLLNHHNRLINIDDKKDQEDLREWCEYHWNQTVKKSMDTFNTLIYHDCCLSFSRRGFSGRSKHPDDESCTIMKIPTFKIIKCAEDFYNWIENRIRVRRPLQREPMFPAINRHHCDSKEQKLMAISQENSYLAKRCEDLMVNNSELQKKNKKLKLDMARLQASSKSWCWKYNQLLCGENVELNLFDEENGMENSELRSIIS